MVHQLTSSEKKNAYFFLRSEAADIPKFPWSVINKKYRENHQNILAVINLVQTLPASSAKVERGFSQLKILKSDIHSTSLEEHLNDLLAVELLSADIQNFDLMPATEVWNMSSVRTRRPLLMDRTSSRESLTAVVATADTIVPSISVVAPSQEETAETTTQLQHTLTQLQPQLQQQQPHNQIQSNSCLQWPYHHLRKTQKLLLLK